MDLKLGCLCLRVPFFVRSWLNYFLGQEQCSKTFFCIQVNIILCLFKDFSLSRCFTQSFHNDRISSFTHEYDSPLGIFNNDAHSLSSAVEFANVQKLVLQLFVIMFVVNHHLVIFVVALEFIPKLLGCVDQSQLIRRRCVIFSKFLAAFTFSFIDNNGVTAGQKYHHLYEGITVLG